MSFICYHASHEQLPPSELLRLVQKAGQYGFQGIHSSDHFHPWSKHQGNSGFSFSWIAAALQATQLPFSMVCAPGQRYHPAIVAQAIATLGEMFPGRINFELASGEALNERVTGQGWPSKEIRNERLLESVGIIRRLLAGEEVSHEGHVRVSEARLYTLPKQQPLLLCAALSEETSQWAGGWADGLLTTGGSKEDTAAKIKAFYANGGAGKPVYLQYSFAYAPTRQQAIEGAWQQWRSNLVPQDELAEMYKPEHFDKAGENVTMEQVAEQIPIFTKPEELYAYIEEGIAAGAERISLHNIYPYHDFFIEDFGKFITQKHEKRGYPA